MGGARASHPLPYCEAASSFCLLASRLIRMPTPLPRMYPPPSITSFQETLKSCRLIRVRASKAARPNSLQEPGDVFMRSWRYNFASGPIWGSLCNSSHSWTASRRFPSFPRARARFFLISTALGFIASACS